MANPTTLNNTPATPAVFKVTTTSIDILVDPLRAHTLQHDGEDDSGTVSEFTVYGSTEAAIDADASEGADKFKLPAGALIQICKGVRTIRLVASSGTVTVSIFPAQHLWDR